MNVSQLKDLSKQLVDHYRPYAYLKAAAGEGKGSEIILGMLISSLSIASLLFDSKTSQKKRLACTIYADGKVLPFGLAPHILADLPDVGVIGPEVAFRAYCALLDFLAKNRLPAFMFLKSLNYANALRSRFDFSFPSLDAEALERLEKSIRRRLISVECASLVVGGRGEKNSLVDAYAASLRRVADTYLRKHDYAGAIGSLVREAEVRYPEIPHVSGGVKFNILLWAHYYNQLLGVFPPSELFEKDQRLDSALTQHQLKTIERLKCAEVKSSDLRNISINPLEGHIDPNSSTSIVFTLAGTDLPVGSYGVGDWRINIRRISDPFHDPTFRFIHQIAADMDGMPLAVLLPVLSSTEGVTLVECGLSLPFHPDFIVNDDGSIGDSLSDSLKRIHGDSYDVYLAKVAELILQIRNDDWPEGRSIEKLIRSADSYKVNFFSPSGELSYHFFRPLVKLGVFLSAKERFSQRFGAAIKSGGRSDSLKKILFAELTLDANALRHYVKTVFSELIVRESENGEWWKTVWVEGSDFASVRAEPDVARDIYNVVSHWFRVKGLCVDREVRASGGSIDMLVTGAANSEISRCGVEVKFAHHQNVIHGVSHQLPDYMDDLRAEAGIYMVIWCKGDKFSKPTNYASMEELADELKRNVPKEKRIDVVSVNASYRPAPSKRI